MATFREYKDKNSKPELVFIKNVGDFFRDEINNEIKKVGLEGEKYRIQKLRGKRYK